MEERVVVLPEPVAPVTRMSPLGFAQSSVTICTGRPSSEKFMMRKGNMRIATPT